MNEPQDAGPSGMDAVGTAATDLDARFDPAASGLEQSSASDTMEDDLAAVTAERPMTLTDITDGCSAWVRDKPMQALGVAAGLGFLLGRMGR
jgi:hypothetical protein